MVLDEGRIQGWCSRREDGVGISGWICSWSSVGHVAGRRRRRRLRRITKKEGRITESRSIGSRPTNGCLAAVLVWCMLASLLVLSPSLDAPWKRVLRERVLARGSSFVCSEGKGVNVCAWCCVLPTRNFTSDFKGHKKVTPISSPNDRGHKC